MKKWNQGGDTPLGRRLQKKADKKRENESISEYIALDLEGLSREQRRLKILELSERHDNE